MSTKLHDAVADYIARGWRPIVVKERSKLPASAAWQNTRPEPENFGATQNVGLILGPASGGLVDIDLDWPEARAVAALPALFGDLPAFGREGQPPGHRLVLVPDLPEDDARVHQLKSKSLGCVLEVRAGGGHTVVPPSVHEGEVPVVWASGATPSHIPEIPWEQVRLLARLAGLLAVALRHYPSRGGRDDFCMHLGGALMHLGVPAETGDELMRGLAHLAGDEEADMRGRKCSGAWAARERGENVTGLPRLVEDHLGEEAGKALRRWLGVGRKEEAPAEPIPPGAIQHDHPDLARFFDETVAAFMSRDPELIYRRAGSLARTRVLDEVEIEREDGVRFQKQTVEIAQVSDGWLMLAASRLGITFFTRRGDKTVITQPPGELRLLLAASDETRFPRLRGISTTPTLDRDEPGYDPASRLLLHFPKGAFPAISRTPTQEEARAALDRLAHPLRKFPFKGGEGRPSPERSVVLSAVLTGVARGEIATAPLHAFSAPVAGTGKTKLAAYVAAIVTGAEPNLVSFTPEAGEMEKRLVALMLRGCQLVNIDNVNDPLDGDTLCAVLTSPTFTGRVLGESRMVELDTRMLVMATGNNLATRGDMGRRTIMCRVDAGDERPDSRRFDFDPVADARAARGQMVADALTVLRGFIAAGSPTPKGHRPLGSFEDWDRLVRCALLWLGEPDPVATQDELRQDDETREEAAAVLQILWDKYGDEKSFSIADLHGEPDESARGVIGSFLSRGEWDRRRAGYLLRRLRDRPVGDLVLRLEKDTATNANRFRVRKTRGV